MFGDLIYQAHRLRELREELRLDGIPAEMNCGGQIMHELVMKSPRPLRGKVMPQFN